MTLRKWIFLITLLIGVGQASRETFSANLETRIRIEEVRTAAAKHKSFRIEVMPPPVGALAQSVGTGTITWTAPYFTRIEVFEPVPGVGKMQRLNVCDGKTVWSVFPAENLACKIDLSKLLEKWSAEELARKGVLVNADPFQGADEESIVFLKQDKFEDAPCYLFELPAVNQPGKLAVAHHYVLWVGVKDGLVRVKEVFSRDNISQDRVVVRVVELDPKVLPEEFQFTPPADCKVEDVTDKVMEGLGEPKEQTGDGK